jgi:uncharacterized membrane protein (DUF4010 family)
VNFDLPPETAPFLDAALAIGLGLTIGLEREHHEIVESERPDSERPHEALLGVRTFALLALGGWAAGFLATSEGMLWLPPMLLVAVAALLCVPLVRAPRDIGGLTTEAAAFVTVLIGVIVPHHRALAVAVGVGTAVLLISKPWFKRVLPRLRRGDFIATIQVVVALAIVLPLLPQEARDPWGALSPRRIGLFVTLILSVSWVGYVLSRVLGPERGAGLTGLVGGLVSSTAVTATMAQRAARTPALALSGQMATFLACAVMSARLLVIAAVISPRVALAAAPAVGTIGVGMLLGALWKWRAGGAQTNGEQTLELDNPMSLMQAVKWGVFMTAVLLAAAVGARWLGDRGVLGSAALSGLADVDAIALAVTRSAADGTLSAQVAVLAVVIASTVNTLVKAGIAWSSGGRAYGRDIAVVFVLSAVAGVAVAGFAAA